MRTTVVLDDDLVEEASRLSGIADRTDLLRAALNSLVARESAQRLAALAGSIAGMEHIPRRTVN
jgi:predicted transcriptional regulator